MLEDKIIVQDRGFDAGLAALKYTKNNYHRSNFQCLIRLERNQLIQL